MTLVNSKYKILVVDDDLDLNTTFALLLEFDGHEVRTVNTCAAALALMEKDSFDVILVEYWLPHMNGDELAALVKQKWPDLPVILATADLEELNQRDLVNTGVDYLLEKPFSLSQLRDAMSCVLVPDPEHPRSGPRIHLETIGYLATSANVGPISKKSHGL